MAHTSPGSGEGQADLLAFGDEVALFADQRIAPPRRGPGRPPGSPNRATLQLKRLMLARGYRDPAEFLSALMSMDVRELAGQLRPDGKARDVTFEQAVEALRLQVRGAEALLPYFHQKMPIAVEHSGESQRPVIIINDHHGAARTALQGRQGDAAMSVHEPVEYQRVSDGETVASHETASDDVA